MARERFADRFDASTYSGDEPVRVWCVDEVGVDGEFLLRESLWHRLRLVAAAYGLHLLPVLDGSTDPVFLSAVQCEGLLDELDFVETVTDDGLLATVSSKVTALVSRARNSGSEHALGIEFP